MLFGFPVVMFCCVPVYQLRRFACGLLRNSNLVIFKKVFFPFYLGPSQKTNNTSQQRFFEVSERFHAVAEVED